MADKDNKVGGITELVPENTVGEKEKKDDKEEGSKINLNQDQEGPPQSQPIGKKMRKKRGK